MIAKELDLWKFWMVVSNGMGVWDQVLNLSVLQTFPPLYFPSPIPTLFTPKLQFVVLQKLNFINTGLKPHWYN